MTDALNIRRGAPGDVAACAAMKNAWIDGAAWMPRVHPAEDLERHYREVVFQKRAVFVAGDPAEGFVALDDEGFVTSLFTARQGRGVGKALLDFAKTQADMLQLWCFVANDGARRFYEREGFVEAERSDGDNEENLPDILYRWEAA